ncbi:MAG: radical SAM protein [Lentisphaeria bacterium]|nr:radical SAM protein [Lentisphaeria bacterium]
MTDLCFASLHSGGLMTNYVCNSSCAHCLYRSSPRREKGYISEDVARAVFRRVRSLGCRSMHIGGGEPFLDAGGLKRVLRIADEEGMGIDYVETNCGWFRDASGTDDLLRELIQLGCGTLLLSIDPFHNAHIPFGKVKEVMAACSRTNMNVFPWRMEFFDEIDALDDTIAHGLDEYEARYGAGYLRTLLERYGVTPGGRALETLAPFLSEMSWEEALDGAPRRCADFTNTSHFHVDMHGHYIPARCVGMFVRMEDLGAPLDPAVYPTLTTLHGGGLRSLLERARTEADFTPGDTYRSHCELCTDIRRHVATTAPEVLPDLGPCEFYTVDAVRLDACGSAPAPADTE